MAAHYAFADFHRVQAAFNGRTAACTARIAHGGRLVELVTGGQQQAAFVFVAGRGNHHVRHAAQEAQIVCARVGGAVRADNACAVDGEQNGQVLQGDIVQELVVCALQEGGVNRHHGFDALAGQPCGKGNGVLFGNADIEIAVGEALFEFHQPAAFAHGGRDGD